MQEINFEQGSDEWLQLRMTKITSTDAAVILGTNPWKTVEKLREEKLGVEKPKYMNAAMQRGVDLEPVARALYENLYGIKLKPKVFVRDFMMASLDGIDESNQHMIEIKCPSEKEHAKALTGHIPAYYYAQIQHQMTVLGLDHMYYFSFDGFFGHRIRVEFDVHFAARMVEKERDFYNSLFLVEHKCSESVTLRL